MSKIQDFLERAKFTSEGPGKVLHGDSYTYPGNDDDAYFIAKVEELDLCALTVEAVFKRCAA